MPSDRPAGDGKSSHPENLMKLGTRIMWAGSGAVVLTTALSIAIVYFVSSHNRVAELRGRMSAIIEQSELVAQNMDDMHASHVFDLAGVREASLRQAGGVPLREVYAAPTSTRRSPSWPPGYLWKEPRRREGSNSLFPPARTGRPQPEKQQRARFRRRLCGF